LGLRLGKWSQRSLEKEEEDKGRDGGGPAEAGLGCEMTVRGGRLAGIRGRSARTLEGTEEEALDVEARGRTGAEGGEGSRLGGVAGDGAWAAGSMGRESWARGCVDAARLAVARAARPLATTVRRWTAREVIEAARRCEVVEEEAPGWTGDA
jgi:hypothetical protein